MPQNLKIAARTIVIAVLSNTVVKTGVAVFVGRGCSASHSTVLATLLLLIAAAVGAMVIR